MTDEICDNCKSPILVTIFKGTGVCSVNCEKKLKGEATIPNKKS